MAYVTWTQAKVYVDQDAQARRTGDIDMRHMTDFIATVEKQLDNQLRRYMTVPVALADSADTYVQVQDICAMRAAAMYLRWSYSAQGLEEACWWAAELDKMAAEAITLLTTGRSEPTDAQDATYPLQYIPYDGKAESSTAPTPIFDRDNVASGSGHW